MTNCFEKFEAARKKYLQTFKSIQKEREVLNQNEATAFSEFTSETTCESKPDTTQETQENLKEVWRGPAYSRKEFLPPEKPSLSLKELFPPEKP